MLHVFRGQSSSYVGVRTRWQSLRRLLDRSHPNVRDTKWVGRDTVIPCSISATCQSSGYQHVDHSEDRAILDSKKNSNLTMTVPKDGSIGSGEDPPVLQPSRQPCSIVWVPYSVCTHDSDEISVRYRLLPRIELDVRAWDAVDALRCSTKAASLYKFVRSPWS